jgi:hypothetical protein
MQDPTDEQLSEMGKFYAFQADVMSQLAGNIPSDDRHDPDEPTLLERVTELNI